MRYHLHTGEPPIYWGGFETAAAAFAAAGNDRWVRVYNDDGDRVDRDARVVERRLYDENGVVVGYAAVGDPR